MEFAGRHPISRPVEVEGAVRNTADAPGAGADGPDHAGRRVRPLRQGVSPGEGRLLQLPILAEELQNEDSDEIVLLEDGQVDAGESGP